MIDVENQVFDKVFNAVSAKFPNADITGETVLKPEKFPSVSVELADSYVRTSGIDSGEIENYSNVMFEVNVFSNKSEGKKSEAKAIFDVVDNAFALMGFTRQSMSPMNMNTSTVYRIVGRYVGTVGRDLKIYRR